MFVCSAWFVLRFDMGRTADPRIAKVMLPMHQGKVTRGAGLHRPDDDVQHVRRLRGRSSVRACFSAGAADGSA